MNPEIIAFSPAVYALVGFIVGLTICTAAMVSSRLLRNIYVFVCALAMFDAFLLIARGATKRPDLYGAGYLQTTRIPYVLELTTIGVITGVVASALVITVFAYRRR